MRIQPAKRKTNSLSFLWEKGDFGLFEGEDARRRIVPFLG